MVKLGGAAEQYVQNINDRDCLLLFHTSSSTAHAGFPSCNTSFPFDKIRDQPYPSQHSDRKTRTRLGGLLHRMASTMCVSGIFFDLISLLVLLPLVVPQSNDSLV